MPFPALLPPAPGPRAAARAAARARACSRVDARRCGMIAPLLRTRRRRRAPLSPPFTLNSAPLSLELTGAERELTSRNALAQA